MMSDSIITTGGTIWVIGGELVNPFWLILVYKGGVMVMLSSLVVSYLFFIENQ